MSSNALDARINEGTFPAPVKIGPRSVAFILSEVLAWQAARVAERDAKLALKRAERERAEREEAERTERKAQQEARERGTAPTRTVPRYVSERD
jgi:hypothetical protein